MRRTICDLSATARKGNPEPRERRPSRATIGAVRLVDERLNRAEWRGQESLRRPFIPFVRAIACKAVPDKL